MHSSAPQKCTGFAEAKSCLGRFSPSGQVFEQSLRRLRASWQPGRRHCSAAQLNTAHGPDATLTHDNIPIHLFSVEHHNRQPYIGEFILRQRPTVVVVETAVSPEHGAATGNVFRCADSVPGGGEFFPRMFCHLAAQLADLPDPAASALWRDLQRQFVGEQCAYIAALAVSASLVFGDRPKADTYRRLDRLPSLQDLDMSFGLQSALNYEEAVTGRPAVAPLAQRTCVEHILLTQRDATFCASLAAAASGRRAPSNGLLPAAAAPVADAGGGPSVGSAAGGGERLWQRPSVVGVLGEAHLQGVLALWEGGRWREALEDVGPSPEFNSGEAAANDGVKGEDHAARGVRRALLESVLALSCSGAVTDDLAAVLGPLPDQALEPYALARELYGSTRMLLACLPDQALARVASGWRCDLAEVLAPVRAARPISGGSGCDFELVMELRTLHFDLP